MKIIKDTIDDIRDDLDYLKSDREMIKSTYNMNEITIEPQPRSYREINSYQYDESYKEGKSGGLKINNLVDNSSKYNHKLEQKTFEKRLKNKSVYSKKQYKNDYSSIRNYSCPDKGHELKLNFQYRARDYSNDQNNIKNINKKRSNHPRLPPVSGQMKETYYLVN